ncbi:putative E3 ubiquitin-protein ligase RHB1A [Curcuma longa]|uniref:putative E3 ubiquitin-protein ligase RHB1A n=1 Tax=Curcuma longa TaxID=136217 RepID=UPI003D9E25C5
MGGCCCCSSRGAESHRTPTYFYCPQDLEREPLSSNSHVTVSAISSGLLVDTNLDTSTPDTYRSPPAPLPFDVGLTSSQVVFQDIGSHGTKTDQTIEETNDNFEILNCKSKIDSDHNSPKVTEDEVSKPIISTADEEDVCPICLEEYDSGNPRIRTRCQHDFHLSCILEWMERSDTCAICDQITTIDDSPGNVSNAQQPL